MMIKPLNILGLMGGTALDGIKIALINTDGIDVYEVIFARKILYPDSLRQKIRAIIGKKSTSSEDAKLIEQVDIEFTDFLYETVNETLGECGIAPDYIGLEGPTICHDAQNCYTYQLGKGKILAEKSGIKVVTHFHNADILNGGQGSPVMATYYASLAQSLEKPAVFINIGGITSLTWSGHLGEITAFDCGPGNALIDDWVFKHTNMMMDYNGKLAATGIVHEKIVAQMMKQNFFAKYPPKSADRNSFNDKIEHLEGLSLADGAATATALIAEAVAYSLALYLPEVPKRAVICGGGAQNPTLVRFLRQKLKDMSIEPALSDIFEYKIGDAQAAAFLAARRVYSLPITFPTTTGVPSPITGGVIYEKEQSDDQHHQN